MVVSRTNRSLTPTYCGIKKYGAIVEKRIETYSAIIKINC